MNDNKFVTSRGVTIEILAIQSLLEKFEAAEFLPRIPEELHAILGESVPKPDAPVYDVKTITGKVETHFHDETTVTTNEEKLAWAEYREKLSRYEADRSRKRVRLIILHGIRVEMPMDETWVTAQEELSIKVPSDPIERKIHYIQTEVLGGIGDFLEVSKRCTMAGLPEEATREAEALFQREMEKFFRNATTKTADSGNGQMVSELPLRESASSDSSGPSPAISV